MIEAIPDFIRHHGMPPHGNKILAKRDIQRKIFVVAPIGIAIQTSEHLD